ncbi:MAG: winged helix-turn-helix transcriptional regulator, partial [Chloroflexi bacterium]|nr:winged helix-turn-helix transcriptional regulator [Chloroflexota bacterium]
MSHRPFKQRLYPQFARIGQALASEKRLELLDLLAQAPRHVEALAEETEMSLANVSQHLQVLRRARLVETDRDGTKILYRLADEGVLRLWLALRSVAESRLAEVAQITREYTVDGAGERELPRDELERLVERGEVFLID